ncbi:hypothetical protein E2562_036990 [Oryza meyeriana var. granulata]|uniref:Uncharacterized protein n=1 Tax=Oryza meyeriana var. granulata TaxID=110450 RepID=A0A6G1F1W9_9ORYZ|nr:hypothetical protein E2562_036990 [Oryza meyeriana var. granulata]
MAVNFFEPLANVLRRMDSDVPAMGFLHGCMLEAKKEIAMSKMVAKSWHKHTKFENIGNKDSKFDMQLLSL